jgi:hypothetical protein
VPATVLTPTRAHAAVCPGPFAPPVLGNLPAIARMDLIGFLDHCRQQYGSIFKVCGFGGFEGFEGGRLSRVNMVCRGWCCCGRPSVLCQFGLHECV